MKLLLVRILVVLAAFLAASMVAAFVITFGMLLEWEQVPGASAGWFAVAIFGLIVSLKGLLPAVLMIALTEALQIRSVLFYAAAGGLGLVALYHGLGLAERGTAGGLLVGRELEIMAGAGIAGGFVYWMIAGRKAGLWRQPHASSANS